MAWILLALERNQEKWTKGDPAGVLKTNGGKHRMEGTVVLSFPLSNTKIAQLVKALATKLYNLNLSSIP